MSVKKLFVDAIRKSLNKKNKNKPKDIVSIFAEAVVNAVQNGDDQGNPPDDQKSQDSQNQPKNNQDNKEDNSGNGKLPSAPDDKANPVPKKIDSMEPDKQAYFLALALRDVKNIVDVANFNMKGALKPGLPVITNMYAQRDGSAIVDIHMPFSDGRENPNKEDLNNIDGAFDMKLREEYAEIVEYRINKPTISNPEVSVDLTLTIPKALLDSIGANNFDTRTKVIKKYVESLVRKELA